MAHPRLNDCRDCVLRTLISLPFITNLRQSASTRTHLVKVHFQAVQKSNFFGGPGKRVLYSGFLASDGSCVLVSAHVQLTPCKWLINISLKLYFKNSGLFHKAEENPVNNSFPLGLRGRLPMIHAGGFDEPWADLSEPAIFICNPNER
jgi:hypothetical protein